MLNSNEKYDIRFVAIYIRKSRAENFEDLERHRLVLTDLCKKHNVKYVEYMEVGSSDSIDMRPQISKLLKEVEDGVYDAVCVVEYDRLSRGDMGDQDRIAKVFRKSETLIITPDKIYDLNDDIDDEMVEFKGFMARREYKMITKRLRQGKKIGARQGQWTNGIPPFPYEYQRYRDKFNDKGLVVNDEKLVIYRDMIALALEGIVPNKIAVKLNNRGYVTNRGNLWSGIAVQRIITDETHLGKIISNKTQGDGHKNKRPNAKESSVLPKSEWVVVENCHEPIKTQEEHDLITQSISARTLIPNKSKKQTHVFTGLIKCAICGSTQTFHRRGFDKNGTEIIHMKPCWYVDKFGKKCSNSAIRMDYIEEVVLREISNYKDSIFTNDFTDEVDTSNKLQDEIDQKETFLAKLKKALDRLNDSYEMGDYSREEWLERKRKREDEIQRTKNEIYELRKRGENKTIIQHEERVKNLTAFFDTILTCTSSSQRNSLYRTIIDSIIWLRTGDAIEVKINFL